MTQAIDSNTRVMPMLPALHARTNLQHIFPVATWPWLNLTILYMVIIVEIGLQDKAFLAGIWANGC